MYPPRVAVVAGAHDPGAWLRGVLLGGIIVLAVSGNADGREAEHATMQIEIEIETQTVDEPVNERPLHHTGSGFRNPYSTLSHNRRRASLGWREMRRSYNWLREQEKIARAQAHLVAREDPDLEIIHNPKPAPQITWIGHATVLIQYRGINIITDPTFSDYCGPVSFLGPKRLNPPAFPIKDLPRIDYVLISHNHYDHLDLATVRHLGSEPMWLVPLGLKDWLKRVGVDAARVVELDWWEEYSPNAQLVFTATPAQHWSRRGIRDYNRTLWSSWHLRLEDFNAWFSGDTGYNPYQFVDIGKRLPSPDIAFIPIGAYEPRNMMRTSHVNPHEAVKIFQDIGAHTAIGIHWGTFSLSAEGLMAPVTDLQLATQQAELPVGTFEAPVLGRTFDVTISRKVE